MQRHKSLTLKVKGKVNFRSLQSFLGLYGATLNCRRAAVVLQKFKSDIDKLMITYGCFHYLLCNLSLEFHI